MNRLALVALLLSIGSAAAAQQGAPPRPAAPAWIGVSYDLRWLQHRDGCVSQMVIESVVPGSPAERAGVRAGDAVVAIDGDRSVAARLPVLTGRLSPGDSIRLLIDRDGAPRQVTVVAGRRPERATAPPAPAAGRAGVTVQPVSGPVIQVRGDTLIASNLARWPGGPPAAAAGYWLAGTDGQVTFRRLTGSPSSTLDRRATDLLVCADSAARALPLVAARVDVARIQEQAESLRVVFGQRALELRDTAEVARVLRESAVLIRAGETGLREGAGHLRPDEAIIASLRGVAGAELFALGPDLGEYFRGVREGALVLRVGAGTAAHRSGLRAGDVIVAAAGRRVTAPDDVRAALAAPGAGAVELAVVRQGRQRTISLTRP
jgi:S1-C subfamily serine protease